MTQLTPEQLAEIVARDEIGSLHSTGPEIHTELVADRRALLSHIDALSLAERHAVREYAKWFEQCVQHEERIAALTAEIAALRRDAEHSHRVLPMHPKDIERALMTMNSAIKGERCIWPENLVELRNWLKNVLAIDSAMSPRVLPEREG